MSVPSAWPVPGRIAGIVVIAVLGAACSSGTGGGYGSAASVVPTAAAPTRATSAAPSSAAGGGRYGGGSGASSPNGPAGQTIVIGTTTTSLGLVLSGKDGQTLYTHSGDSATSSTCTGGCLSAWPAVTVSAGGKATAGAGASGTLGTFVRTEDGITQVTYNGRPVYYWQGDHKSGDVTGDGVAGFSVAKP